MSTVLVAGGGIGGLAAALSVAQAGHRAVVLERRGAFTELGAGIQIGPNGFHALDRLGVGDAVRALAVYVDELRFMDGTTDERVRSMPLTERYRKRFGNPYAVVRRADLYEPLLAACRACDAVDLRTDSRVTAYEQDAASVTAVLESGQRVRGAALVGADGIRSAVRAQLVGDGEPRVSGHTIFRSVIPMDEVPPHLRWNCVTLWAGPRWHFVHYPIGEGKYLNLAATRDDGARQVVVGRPTGRDRVLGAFADLGRTARELLELGAQWREWVLCDRDPVGSWTDRRVTLLGDAAHPMLQYAAQGACMALEDAVVLGEVLACAEGGFALAWAEYESRRRRRTADAQWVAREMGRSLYHPAGQEAAARNAMLSGLSDDALYEKVSWLHDDRGFSRALRPVGAS
ncbi:3-hydroxybenzoate 6-monooxygenase [Streptomyces antimicrobicus]|uniref:3-hydroxybenzoate 6-monooxygenase n=1 Tax=Streptomyces antimicrobicus TaxID=2883108 RepID=A0ABS8B022_9ACTN|nr:3-hydroxybenzoate 6-monooxygenase [Streptomyces antimicrobicus]MCB5177951.1 3-hydroxybenzoate 6-monooxygenase [Streptomyces antimicrobicus]